jgi:hypothetical protein
MLPQPRKPYVQRDRRYVIEWVNENYPNDRVFFNFRLGPAPLALAEKYPGIDINRYARVWKRTCDAVIITKDEILLIEGELRRPVEGLGELLIYRDLIWSTTELSPYRDHKIRTILLVPLHDPQADAVAKKNEVETIIYRPKWVDEYLKEVMR